MSMAMLILAMFVVLPSCAQKKKKEKKEKKPYEWTWDRTLSGDKIVDEYLLSVDSIWYQMKEVNEINNRYSFKVDTIKVGADYYTLAYMLTPEGKLVTRGTVNWAFTSIVFQSTDIVAKAALVAVQTAGATLSLPNLGLKALSYGKYVKGGAIVLGMAAKGIKEMWGTAVANAKRWNAMKKGAIDPTTIGYQLTDHQIENINKCAFLKKIEPTSPEYTEIHDVQSKKTEEQLAADLNASMTVLSGEQEPAQEGKQLDELNDDFIEA